MKDRGILKRLLRKPLEFIPSMWGNGISLFGAAMTTVSACAILFMLAAVTFSAGFSLQFFV